MYYIEKRYKINVDVEGLHLTINITVIGSIPTRGNIFFIIFIFQVRKLPLSLPSQRTQVEVENKFILNLRQISVTFHISLRERVSIKKSFNKTLYYHPSLLFR